MMKKYNDIGYALDRTIRILQTQGTKKKAGIWQASELFKDQEMLVYTNMFFAIQIPMCYSCLEITGADLPWAEQHFQERISGNPTNPGESYKIWPYNNFKGEDDPYMQGQEFSHTYQERFWPKYAARGLDIPNKIGKRPEDYGLDINKGLRYDLGDLNDVIKQLRNNHLTRQAYLPVFFPEDTGAVHKQRVPCTLGYYFWIEEGQVNCNYIIRSCDALRHFRNDVYLTARLMQHIAKELKLSSGTLHFMAFNFHVFVNDLYALNKKEHNLRNEGKNK